MATLMTIRHHLALSMLLLAAGTTVAHPAEPSPAPEPESRLSTDSRNISVALLWDSPVAPGVIDRSLHIVEGLRRRYELFSGDDELDRREAARRALEQLSRLELSDEDVRRMAKRLGFELAPGSCGDACDNVRRLAELHLRMAWLERLALSPAISESHRPE